MWVIFLFFLMGWGGKGWNGFGGNRGAGQVGADLGNLINNDAGRELLMQAIQGNGTLLVSLLQPLIVLLVMFRVPLMELCHRFRE